MNREQQTTATGDGEPQDRIAILAVLSALVRGAAHPASAAIEIERTLRSHPPSDVDARVSFLAARLGLPQIHPARLAEAWTAALKGHSPSRQELLELARRADVTGDEPDREIGPWRRAIFARLEPTLAERGALEFTPDTPVEIRRSHLDLRPLFTDWPRRLLHHPDWAHVEAPLPEMAPLPLADAWVDLRLVAAEEAAAVPAVDAVRDTLDLRYARRRWRSEPLEFMLDRLDGSAVLVGPPGSGKTTLLKWIARQLITHADGRFLLPLIHPLRAYAAWKQAHPEGNLLHFGLYQAGIEDAPQREMWANALSYLAGPRGENILLLLDGWDEVRQEDRAPLQREIDDFGHGFTILLTSRPSGRPEILRMHDLYEITELAPASIERLIDLWFGHAGLPELAATLRAQLDRSLDLGRLARNPFLLTLLCGLALRSARTGSVSLPASRAELYEMTTELIYRQDEKRHGETRWPEARRRQVERLALWLLDEAPEAPRYVFGPEDVAASGAARELLERYLKPSRLLAQWGLAPDSHHFLHTTFQEYFAARGLASAQPGTLLSQLRRHLFSGAWQEVFQFLAGSRGPAQELFWRQLAHLTRELDRFGHLALRLARFVAEAGSEDGGRSELGIDLREILWPGILSFSANELYVDAYAALDPAGLAERVQLMLPTVDGRNEKVLLQAAARIAVPESSAVLIEQILEGDNQAATQAYLQITQYRRVDAPSLVRLRSAAESRRVRPEVRQRAIRALGVVRDHASLDRITAALRDDRANADAVLSALSSLGTDEAITAISRLLEVGDDPQLAGLAMTYLTTVRNPAARDLLLEIVALRSAEDPFVAEALRAFTSMPIHRGGEIILDLLGHSPAADLRAAAAYALAQTTTEGVVEALARASREDREELVRISALRSLERRARPVDAHWLKATIRDESRSEEERARALAALAVAAQRFRRSTDAIWLAPLAAGELLRLLEQPQGDDLTREAVRRASLVGDVAVPRLMALCRNGETDHMLRCEACSSLGQLRAHAAAGLLLELSRRGSEAVLDDSETWIGDWTHSLAQDAARALAAIDPVLLLHEPGAVASSALARWALESGSLVFADRVVGPDGRVTAMAPPLDAAGEGPAPAALEEQAQPADVRLFVRTGSDDGGCLSFKMRIADPRIGPDDDFDSVKLHKSLRGFRADLMLDLEGLSCDDPQSREICRERLEVKGETLFQLLPLGLQAWLWILKDRALTIEILSDGLDLPWELVRLRPQRASHPAMRFLGTALAMTRWFEGSSARQVLPLTRIALVAPNCPDLPSTVAEREYLLSLHKPGTREVVEIEGSYLPVKQALRSGEFDAWHFVGHGDSRAEDPDRWRFQLEGDVALKPEDLRDAGAFGRLRPWVFLNACRTAQGGLSLDGTSGWARRFLAAGAGAFIGTQWSVRDRGAHTFARAFYSRFLGGDPLGKTLWATRNELMDEDPLTALGYSVFGHPLAKCRSVPSPCAAPSLRLPSSP